MISPSHRPPPQYPLLPLLLCLALFCLVYFAAPLWKTDLTTLTALALEKDLETAFTGLGRALSAEPAALFAPPSPVPAATPSSTPTPTPSPTPTPTPTPTPIPTSHPYDGPAAPAGATLDYVPLDLPSTQPPTSGAATSSFGWRTHPLTGSATFHDGIDLYAPFGTDVLAFADGEVLAANWEESYGYYIKIKHSDHVTTFYAHCSQLLKQPGDTVQKGDLIALSGATGHVTGPHLHFEIWVDGLRCDPSHYWGVS